MTQAQPQAATFVAAITAAHFAPVMGFAGLGIAWRIAAGVLAVPPQIGEAIVAFAFAVFAVVATVFAARAVLLAGALLEDFRNSRRLVFYPLLPTSLLLLSIGSRPYSTDVATALWLVAAPLNLYFATVLTGRWLFEAQTKSDISPAWLFPIVGNGVVPIAGVPLGFVEMGWLFFTLSFGLWIIVFAALFQRLVFEQSMTARMMPSIMILMSPPATFFIAYFELTDGRIDPLSYGLIYLSLFLMSVFVLHIKKLVLVPVTITLWSLTFPMAALTIASLLFCRALGWPGLYWLAATMLGATSLAVSFVSLRSLTALRRSATAISER